MPAGFCGCVGIKPTRGRFSTMGAVPCSRSLDCVSIFARSIEDGANVASIMQASYEHWAPYCLYVGYIFNLQDKGNLWSMQRASNSSFPGAST